MIRVHDLHKSFKLFSKPADRLLEAVTGRARHTPHHALRGISFEVREGEVLGVLGRNGAGKSTLLKLLTGVLVPDAGEMHIDGRVTGLLELGTGFNPELSGHDNITINGLMVGMSHAEIESRRQAIIEFSELGDYIHEPLRTYSSGMVMRLGFAVAIHADPSCFLVDEALSVGDGYFQQKCMKRIRQFKEAGGSILFVSHDLNAVKMLCDRAMVLESGRLTYDGDADDAVNYYNRIMARQAEEEEGRHRARQQGVYGSGEAEILRGEALGERSGAPVLGSGETLKVSLDLLAHQALDDLTLGLMIRDRYGQDIFGVNTHQLGQPLRLAAGEQRRVSLEIVADIAPGKYTLTLALHSSDHHLDDCFWWCDSYLQFEVAGFADLPFGGICRLPLTIELDPEIPQDATRSAHAPVIR
ncbi:ABC transporter ATP-binding protein [Halomonas lysinitropha]|uniref:Teichoic acids export ATP-binding protein TagH n=1 Tax=Halomonas lysinitropha TaxID=2607506 RepID=A0A5K1IB66_9GAMM|nr:ABC transporter ATP-binding protein [Halomonas lysinitropha]VVZ95269.1 Teichoic acids export ATP-binding protein TagH [Halomonas lysinitropha]